MTANEEVTREVERELEARGWSRSDFARELGVSPAWVTRRFNGERRWSVDDLDLLHDVVGLRLTLCHEQAEDGPSPHMEGERPSLSILEGVA
jgi:transcriptional regulator with XRE-family HTH domain